LAFAERHRDRLRFDHNSGQWYLWDLQRWQPDQKGFGLFAAQGLAREFNPDSKAPLGRYSTAAGVERLARVNPVLAVTSETWDSDPYQVGTVEGTLDLQTGQVMPADRLDYITKVTACAPADNEACPRWLQFLHEATGGDVEVIRFLRQFSGYCLSGLVNEHVLLFVYGPGGNGKSVFLNTLTGILGDYAKTAAFETFAASYGERHPADLAMLQGARLVTVSETEEGRAWAESRLKQLTGGDPITARHMRQDFFTFKPQFKLIIVGNHKPVLRNIDEAIRRRFRLVPFLYKPAAPDKGLEQKLRDEAPGILRWMVNGFQDWQTNGLISPAAVCGATEAYLDSQDSFGQFLTERCFAGMGEAGSSRLFESWKSFCEARGEKPGDSKRFAGLMVRSGFQKVKRKNGAFYLGISLLDGDG
jgi:putative DNA primase/helicase